MRIDKLLSELDYGTRTEIKKDLKAGLVKVNGTVVKKGDFQVNPEQDIITYQDAVVDYSQFEYYMLNKPAGYVSATKDNVYPTVMELIPSTRKDLAPVGRLDVDTEGLLLITNDGQLAHRLLSPKRHVDKTYYAEIKGIVTDQDVAAFAKGLDIGEDNQTMPAKLEILSADKTNGISQIQVIIQEGKFHQVKRMFQAVGKEVQFLKRLSMGSLILDESLDLGEARPLTSEELATLQNN